MDNTLIEEIGAVRSVIVDEEELKTFQYLKNEKPKLLNEFLINLQAGRRGIFQRLFQALIREKIIEDDRIMWIEGEETQIRVKLPSGKDLYATVKKRYSLGRFEIDGDIRIGLSKSSRILAHPVELLELLKEERLLEEVTEEQFQRFKLEIQNGVASLALALTGAAMRKGKLVPLAKLENINSSLEWVVKQYKKNPNFSPLSFYEQWVIEGHPLHPGAKTRLGMSVEDVIKYSPEWGTTPNIALVAVSKEFCQTTSIDNRTMTSWLYEEYEGLRATVDRTLRNKGLDPSKFELVPVHPWQLEHALPALYEEEIAQKKIVLIQDFHIPAKSLVSFRTLAPLQNCGENKHHIKTAVNIQTTSAVRIVSPNSVENSPFLSKILVDIQEKENYFGGKFVVLQERAGIYFQPTGKDISERTRWKLQANLASILRENPENYVDNEEEIPMVAAALLADSPVSGKPIVIELIDELARHYHLANHEEAALLFIRRYAETSLPGFLTLMVRYGISLEGHMQNSITVFRHGEPIRLLLRDLGGIRVLPERLERNGFYVNFYPGSSIVTKKVDELHSIILYSVIQNHIAELITCIARSLEITEDILWKQVISVCKTIFSELKKDRDIVNEVKVGEQAFFLPTIDLKALTTMRLRGDDTSYSFIKVPNPMAIWKGEAINE